MQHQRTTRRPWLAPALLATLGVALTLLPAAPALGQAHPISIEPAAALSSATVEQELNAGVPPPERVFIQKTSAFPGRGNVLISVQLSASQQAEKAANGTSAFITIGDEADEVILRDDGRGGDAVAGDGLFTGIGTVDQAELDERASDDQNAIATNGSSDNPIFFGRSFGGTVTVEPFDLAGFNAGNQVPLDTAIVTVDSGGAVAGEGAALSESESGAHLASFAAAAPAPKNCTSVPTPSPGVTNVFEDRVLMIRHPAVVEDPARTVNPCTGAGSPSGVWTFNHLMTEMANQSVSGIDPRDFVEQWLTTWTQNPGPTINANTVSTRLVMQKIIDQWRIDSGGGKLDLTLAPFRLVAIVPRLDLRTTDGGGGGYGGRLTGKFLDGGEARFIFGVVLKSHWDQTGFLLGPDLGGGCRALPFTVIFEFRVPKCDCPDVRAWARQWVSLANLDPTTTAYRNRLERITDQFTRAGADPRRPNGSAIGQVRTNEIAMPQDAPLPGGPIWELREFQLTQKPFSFLHETTSADTPQDRFNDQSPLFGGSPLLFDWITGPVQGALIANNDCAAPIPPVPLLFQGSLPASDNFLGANPQVPTPGYHWDHFSLTHAYPFENWARHRTSIAACSGCHARETNTVFLQVNPQVPFGSQALISGFLSGINNVSDPADPANFPNRHFDDLLRREVDIRKVAKMRCLHLHPVNVDVVKSELERSGTLPDDLFSGLAILPEDLQVSFSADDMRRNPVGEVH